MADNLFCLPSENVPTVKEKNDWLLVVSNSSLSMLTNFQKCICVRESTQEVTKIAFSEKKMFKNDRVNQETQTI